MITLFVTPVFYVYMEALRERLARRKGRKAGTLAPVAPLPVRGVGP
jgi:hypothetical protein